MVRYESFRKEGHRYSSVPFKVCTDNHAVFVSLCQELMNKYLHKPTCDIRITRRRCPYCGSFDEVTVFYKFPNGERTKTVYTVPSV